MERVRSLFLRFSPSLVENSWNGRFRSSRPSLLASRLSFQLSERSPSMLRFPNLGSVQGMGEPLKEIVLHPTGFGPPAPEKQVNDAPGSLGPIPNKELVPYKEPVPYMALILEQWWHHFHIRHDCHIWHSCLIWHACHIWHSSFITHQSSSIYGTHAI